MKKSRLGKGISALIPEVPAAAAAATSEIPVADIRPNPLQPRRTFDEDALRELADSIGKHGLLQPVVVSRAPEGGFHLIAGERRFRAVKLLGLETVPAVVREAESDADQLALALIENVQREDLTPIEEARAYHHLRTELGLSQEKIAEQVGKERSTIANFLRLLQLPLEIQERVDSGSLSAGHARAIAGIDDREAQLTMADKVLAEGWSVRELEKRLRPPAPRKRSRADDPETEAAADRLSKSLGAAVEIKRRRRGGVIRIAFSSEQELIRLFERLLREKK